MTESSVVLQLRARWCGRDSRLYLFTSATLGNAYLAAERSVVFIRENNYRVLQNIWSTLEAFM